MIIAAPVQKPESPWIFDSSFGRSKFFALFDTETKESYSIENKARDSVSGAGTESVRLLADLDVECIISVPLGPKASDMVRQLEIKTFHAEGSVNFMEALDLFFMDKLRPMKLEKPSGPGGLYRA